MIRTTFDASSAKRIAAVVRKVEGQQQNNETTFYAPPEEAIFAIITVSNLNGTYKAKEVIWNGTAWVDAGIKPRKWGYAGDYWEMPALQETDDVKHVKVGDVIMPYIKGTLNGVAQWFFHYGSNEVSDCVVDTFGSWYNGTNLHINNGRFNLIDSYENINGGDYPLVHPLGQTQYIYAQANINLNTGAVTFLNNLQVSQTRPPYVEDDYGTRYVKVLIASIADYDSSVTIYHRGDIYLEDFYAYDYSFWAELTGYSGVNYSWKKLDASLVPINPAFIGVNNAQEVHQIQGIPAGTIVRMWAGHGPNVYRFECGFGDPGARNTLANNENWNRNDQGNLRGVIASNVTRMTFTAETGLKVYSRSYEYDANGNLMTIGYESMQQMINTIDICNYCDGSSESTSSSSSEGYTSSSDSSPKSSSSESEGNESSSSSTTSEGVVTSSSESSKSTDEESSRSQSISSDESSGAPSTEDNSSSDESSGAPSTEDISSSESSSGVPICPDNCLYTCDDTYDVTISGVTGACVACAELNTTITCTRSEVDSCVWTGALAGWGMYSVTIECNLGEWILNIHCSSPSGPDCNGGLSDEWEGFIDASACPTGNYSCPQITVGNCGGTISCTVS